MLPTHALSDPYLEYQPHFAFSLPVQILCNGVILTLAAVLLIHLSLTAQYHWPLARLNYVLQLSAVVTLCIHLIATILVVFGSLHSDSRGWPYMLDYIAVELPPETWTIPQQTMWYTMQAVTSGLAHITHIQFLTLMYPSKLEARLIFILLGPLAIASSAMTFCSLSPHKRAQDLGDAIRGVCNTTLALLFSAALFIWGFAVNRTRAWRTDGGTAAFGAAAIFLAIMSVAINFVLIFVENLVWLPTFNWAVVLWQTFLGWWWWVGAGMGIGEVEDMLIREQKRKDERRRKKLVKQRQLPQEGGETSSSLRWRRGRGVGAAAVSSSSSSRWVDALVPDSLSRQRRRARRGEAGDLAPNDLVVVVSSASAEDDDVDQPYHDNTRRRRPHPPSLHSSTHIEMTTLSRPRTPHNNADADADVDEAADTHSITTATTESVTDPVLVPPLIRNIPLVPALYTSCVHALRILRRAHVKAARAEVNAAGSGIRMRGQSAGAGRGDGPSNTGGTDEGWGLGNFGLREREEAERRIREFQEERRRRMLIPPDGDEEGQDEDDGGWHDVDDEDGDAPFSTHDAEETNSPRRRRRGSSESPASPPTTSRPSRPHLHHHPSDPGTDGPPPPLPHPLPPNDSLFWKWGPLRRWRLQDRTTY